MNTFPFIERLNPPLPEEVRGLEVLGHHRLVGEACGEISVDALKVLMADHEGDPEAICRHGAGGTYSIAGYNAAAAAGRFHVRRGHGCTVTWTAYEV